MRKALGGSTLRDINAAKWKKFYIIKHFIMMHVHEPNTASRSNEKSSEN